ncbi:MAG: tRNA lysidine(34) synthetase TilS [Flavobacteriales bacterium]
MLLPFKKYLQTNFSFLKEKKIMVACSGGVDSVVLTHLLSKLNYTISLAHCNFSLRGEESDQDEAFVKKLSKQLNILFFTKTFDTKKYALEHKISTQMAARDLRYNWFNTLLEENKYDYLLTAHHLDDDVETFFINLIRGTGLRGLTGIPEINQKTIRPFLSFSRKEILEYAEENKITWREDSSNKTTAYLRNALRLKVIPTLNDLIPNFSQNFKKSQSNLQESQTLIDDYLILIKQLIVKQIDDEVQINIKKLQDLPSAKALLYELLSPYGFTSWQTIFDLLEAQTGKQIFSKTHRIIKNRDVLLLSRIKNKPLQAKVFEILEHTKKIVNPIFLNFEQVTKISNNKKNSAFVDIEKLNFPLQIRKWQQGDVFYPLGMKGKKKISKFFKDEKLSLVEKEKVWLLTSNNKIVWVVGKRLDERFKVTPQTKKILKIVLEN